ncbi:DoxX family protein [Natronorubrum halophilum]|uniref:DoxX family protein n=1 Tax=Natronorubrum halophilum TaxID=1702106 RepID=UPI000EF75184|nr:DoxX family protein [Natronorubrum halophilum]
MTAQITNNIRRNIGNLRSRSRIVNYSLWIVQTALALIFLIAGVAKFATPMEMMTAQLPIALPGAFILFIGAAEILGAIGLLLPGLLHVREELTPLAAAGLVSIMVGATALTLIDGGIVLALIPLAVGLLAAFVAYGRWHYLSP